MIQTQATKTTVLIQPQAIVNNAEFVGSKGSTPVYVDMAGFNYLDVYAAYGASDIAMVELEVWECDTSGGTYTKVPNAEFGATGQPALPSATDDNKLYAIHIPWSGARARYAEIFAKAGNGSTGTYLCAWAVQSRADIIPSDAAGRGLAGEIFV